MAINTKGLKASVFNWGPCVMQTTVPKYITDKLIEEGRVSELFDTLFIIFKKVIRFTMEK